MHNLYPATACQCSEERVQKQLDRKIQRARRYHDNSISLEIISSFCSQIAVHSLHLSAVIPSYKKSIVTAFPYALTSTSSSAVNFPQHVPQAPYGYRTSSNTSRPNPFKPINNRCHASQHPQAWYQRKPPPPLSPFSRLNTL